MIERTANAYWEGDLFAGQGAVTATSSGLFSEAAVSWAARTEAPAGQTSPEELIAAAHSSCFCMALSNEMSSRGHAPERLEVEATVGFADGKITNVALVVSARAPGADDAFFAEALAAAEASCPVSNALRNNVTITATGHLLI
ncbi:MAG: OsmC family peroxiredoxin [Acidimicrobiales bacterium]